MTRQNLVDAIYQNKDSWSCPHPRTCNGGDCRKCAENLLAKYEKKFYDKGYDAGVEAVSFHLELCKEESGDKENE